MNNMHGPEAVKRLRQIHRFEGKIVGLTGNALPEDVEVFMKAGCDHVIIKPFKIKKLFEFLSSVGIIPSELG